MRKLKNKSITIIISMLLLFVGAFTWLTFSLSKADEYEEEDQPPVASTVIKSNIDLIIQNSNDDEKEEALRKYHIVEISSGTPASFKGFCDTVNANGETQFELLVLNEHRTKQIVDETGSIIDTALMKPGYIDYKSFNLGALRSSASTASEIAANFQPVIEAVASADLIYISCDVTDNGAHIFSKNTDFTEDLKSVLSSYVTNDLKPIIIDSPTKISDELFGSSKTFRYIGAAFGEYGSSRNTFAWQFDNTASKLDPETAMSYFTRTQPSKYLPISGGDVESDKWIRVSYDGKEYNAARILTVKASGGANPITDQIKEGLGSEVTVTEVGGTNNHPAQRIYAGVDVEEEELISEDPDDTYDIFNPISEESGNKTSLTINAAFTGHDDDATYNPTASAKLHILDYKRDEYKSDIDVSDGTKLSYDAGHHAYVIDFTKDNSSITLENIPVECIYYIETTNDDITDSDTFDAEANKAYLPYRVLETGSNTVGLEYTYKADCGSIEYGVFYDTNVLEPGARYFYFALFNDANGELRTEGFDVREARLGNGVSDFINLEWDGVPYGTYFVLETDSTGKVLDGGRLPSSSSQTVDAAHKIVVSSLTKNGNTFASKVKIDYTIADLGIPDDQVPDFQFAIRLRDEKGKLVTGTFPAVLNNGSTNTNVSVEFKDGMAVSTIGGAEVEAVEIPYKGSLTITIPEQYKYRISEISPLKVFSGTDLHYRYNSGNFNDYITAAGSATYTFENDYVESYGSALFYAYKIYQQHPDFAIFETLEYDAADNTKNFSSYNLEDYDIIVFEGNLESVLLATGKKSQPDDYNTLKAFMKNKTANGYYNHIIYASNLVPENNNNQGYEFEGADKFNEFYNSLMIKPDVPNAKYAVLLTSPGEMEINVGSGATASSCDDIAELINRGKYRFSGGSNDYAKNYSVLEIQPCYPIDLGLAGILSDNKENDDSTWVSAQLLNSGGYYYLDYDNVLNGYTADEIQVGSGALSDVQNVSYDNVVETYYEGTGTYEEYQEQYFDGTYDWVSVNQWNTGNTTLNQGLEIRVKAEYLNNITVNGSVMAHDVLQKFSDGSELWKITYYNEYYTPSYDNIHFIFYEQVPKYRKAQREIMEKKTRTIKVRKSSYDKSVANSISLDYYDWEVSPQKILHILRQTNEYKDFTIQDITVDHMSTEEFICNKTSILDNYDLVYIGGNNSAIKDLDYFVANSSSSKSGNILNISDASYYNVYYHNGDVFKYKDNIKGYQNNGYGVQLGNDLTHSKYDELIQYVNNDMPVVISKTLAEAFENSSYGSHKIDPDSRMYAFLDYAKKKDNVGWGIDTIDTERVDLSTLDGVQYQVSAQKPIYSGSVTLYKPTSEKLIINLINSHGSRPKYQYAALQPTYNINNVDSNLKNRTLEFEYDIINMQEGHTYTAYLYLDDNGDSRFDIEKEEVDSKPGALGKIEHTVPDDFFGSVYIQLTISDKYKRNGVEYEQRSSQKMLFKINPPSEEKDRINILQVLPKGAQKAKTLRYGAAGTGYDTLFFCTECQLVGGILEAGTNANGASALKNDSVFKRDGSGKYEPELEGFSSTLGTNATTIKNNIESYEHSRDGGDSNYVMYVNTLGVHEHTFGIPIYKDIEDAPEWKAALGEGTYQGLDDYNSNWADYIADDYDFNMDIIETDEFNDMVVKIGDKYNGLTSTEIEQLRTKYKDSSATFENYYNIIDTLIEKSTMEYQPYTLSYINEIYNAIPVSSGGDPTTDINTLRRLRGLLKSLYSINNITWTSSDTTFDGMSLKRAYEHVGDLISAANTRLGFSSTSSAAVDFFNYMENEFGFSKADMADFESIMHDLGATDTDIKNFTMSEQGVRNYITNTVMPKTQSQTKVFDTPSSLVKSYLEQILTNKRYADYFSLCNFTDTNPPTWEYTLTDYTALFKKWRDASIYRKYFLNMYMNDARFAAVNDDGKVDFTSLYSIIILGPADDFNNEDMEDPSTEAIKTYIDNDGHVLLFYDTITINKPAGGKKNAENLTEDLRDIFGQDARPESELKIGGSNLAGETYYISNLSNSGTSTPSTTKVLIDEAITNRSMLYDTDKGQTDAGYMNAYMYKYGAYIFYPENENNKYQAYHQIGKEQLKNSITDRASRNNEGMITMYPFALKPNLNITSTNPQAFNLDIEDEDMTVYYTLAGGTGVGNGGQSTNSSLFAASPNDGADNYFIYQYKNVTYCGAGNTVVTGLGTDNNDERKLFINVIVNTLRKSAIGTQVRLYDALKSDKDGKVINPMANANIKPTGTGLYEIEAKSMTDSPEFSFYIKTDKNVTITRVSAYYDLDLADDAGEILALNKSHPYDTDVFADANSNVKHQNASGGALPEHVLIYDTGAKLANLRETDRDLNKKQRNVNIGIVKDITKNSDGSYSSYNAGLQGVTYGESSNGSYYAAGCNLELREDYFKPYDGAYTFITVRVETKDSRGRDLAPIYRRIKVVLPYDLFDLN